MRALVVSELASDYAGCAISDVPASAPGPGEVLVKVRAAAVNFPDLLMTRGEYQYKPPLPFIPGMEMAGEIVSVGENVPEARIGEAVVGGGRCGCMAEFMALPAEHARPKPANLDWAQAASYRSAYLTAWVALTRRGNVQPGEWVLVHGSAGGMGLAAVDLAKHLGAKVIATGSSDAKLAEVARLMSPDATINVRDGFRETVKALTGGRGADVIYDPVGGDVFDESVRCIGFDGRLLVIGFTSGRISTIHANMPLIKGFSVVGVRAGEYGRQFPERGKENTAAVDALAASGAIRPHVHAELPLDQWREGFDMLANRQVVGKVVLTP